MAAEVGRWRHAGEVRSAAGCRSPFEGDQEGVVVGRDEGETPREDKAVDIGARVTDGIVGEEVVGAPAVGGEALAALPPERSVAGSGGDDGASPAETGGLDESLAEDAAVEGESDDASHHRLGGGGG